MHPTTTDATSSTTTTSCNLSSVINYTSSSHKLVAFSKKLFGQSSLKRIADMKPIIPNVTSPWAEKKERDIGTVFREKLR